MLQDVLDETEDVPATMRRTGAVDRLQDVLGVFQACACNVDGVGRQLRRLVVRDGRMPVVLSGSAPVIACGRARVSRLLQRVRGNSDRLWCVGCGRRSVGGVATPLSGRLRARRGREH